MHSGTVRTLVLALAFTLAAVLAAGAQAQSGNAQGIVGTWEGRIETQPALEVIVRLDDEGGGPSGTIDIPAQDASGLPLDAIEVQDDTVRFVIGGVPGSPTFEGRGDGDRISGTFTQGDGSFPFELARVDAGAVPSEEPATAADPPGEDAAARDAPASDAPAADAPGTPGPGPASVDPARASGEAADVYEDPAGVYTVPVPTGWTVEERDGFVTLVSPEGGIRQHLVVVVDDDPEAAIEQAWAVADPDADVPVDTTIDAPSDPGIERTVVVNYDSPDGELHQAIAQLHEGVSHVMLVDAEIAAAQRRGSQVNIVLSGYTILALEEVDLAGVEPRPVGEIVDELEPFIDEAVEAFGVPGAAVAVVQDGEVAYASGFGVRRDGGQPMTADTHMMIGSTGKTLTTTLMATMVDEGLFDWDTPVAEVLPAFEVADAELSETMEMWHLVCACSGVPRRDLELLFNADGMTAEDVVESLATFEFFTDFGEAFQYSNQLVGTGGFAAAAADGAAWGELWQGYAGALERRVSEPIGMPNTTLSFDDVVARGEYARPHQLDLDSGAYTEVPLDVERLLVPIAPAGSHWSTADDMARFMLTQMRAGVAPDGTRVASEENLRATWEPNVPISATASYGLGWIVDEYRGLRLLSHGGNTLGFTSEFAFLPDAGIGILVAANAQGANAFAESVRQRLFELAFEQPLQSEELMAFGLEQTERRLTDLQERLRSSVDEDAVAPYVGSFASPELGTITLTLEGGVLMLDAGEFRTELRPAVDTGAGADAGTDAGADTEPDAEADADAAPGGEVEGYVAMEGPIATTPFELTEEDGEPVVVLGEGAVSYTFERVR